MKKEKQTNYVKADSKEYEFADDVLEQVSGGTVQSGGEKPKIKGLEADIEGALNIIHYENKEQ